MKPHFFWRMKILLKIEITAEIEIENVGKWCLSWDGDDGVVFS